MCSFEEKDDTDASTKVKMFSTKAAKGEVYKSYVSLNIPAVHACTLMRRPVKPKKIKLGMESPRLKLR